MEEFRKLGVKDTVLSAIKKIGFYEPTPVQAATIPLILAGRDVIAGSNTGSGKTFAFAAGIIQQIQPKAGVQALILVPTRELADQMMQSFKAFCKETSIKITAIYGGVSLKPQFSAIKQSEIVIATPGRTLDHLERETLDLSRINHIILDEADRMLDMGFLPDVKRILKHCPDQKQLLLFSATMPGEIKKLAKQFMHDPEHINLAVHVDPRKLSQETYIVSNNNKPTLLAHLLKEEDQKELVIIFCNTRRQVDNTTKSLKYEGIKAIAIHGGLSQNQRLRVIKSFTSKNSFNALVCTDVAARGLDIPGVTHVYNYDIPNDSKQYVHRIGRTARAGADGKAINLVNQRDRQNYQYVLSDNDLDIPIKKVPIPDDLTQDNYDDRRAPRRGSFRSSRGPRSSGNHGGFGGSPRKKSGGFGAKKSFSRDDKEPVKKSSRFGDKKPSGARRRDDNSGSRPPKNKSSFGSRSSTKPKRSFGRPRKGGSRSSGRR